MSKKRAKHRQTLNKVTRVVASGAIAAALVIVGRQTGQHSALVEGCKRAYLYNLGPMLQLFPPEARKQLEANITAECQKEVDQN